MRTKDKVRAKKLIKEQHFYKIYNTKTKLFSDGGNGNITYSKIGKTYYKASDIKRHLSQSGRSDLYKDCLVIKFENRPKIISINKINEI